MFAGICLCPASRNSHEKITLQKCSQTIIAGFSSGPSFQRGWLPNQIPKTWENVENKSKICAQQKTPRRITAHESHKRGIYSNSVALLETLGYAFENQTYNGIRCQVISSLRNDWQQWYLVKWRETNNAAVIDNSRDPYWPIRSVGSLKLISIHSRSFVPGSEAMQVDFSPFQKRELSVDIPNLSCSWEWARIHTSKCHIQWEV